MAGRMINLDKSWLDRGVQVNETNKLDGDIRAIHAAAREALALDTRRLLEDIFVRVWLPIFANAPKEKRDKRYNHVDLANWVTYAGNAARSVHVVNAMDEVLFTVPPLVDPRAHKPSSKTTRGGSIFNVLMTMQALQRNGQIQQAKAFLQRELQKRAGVNTQEVDILAYIKTWNDIFTRYGYPPLMVELTEQALAKKEEQQDENKPTSGDGWDECEVL